MNKLTTMLMAGITVVLLSGGGTAAATDIRWHWPHPHRPPSGAVRRCLQFCQEMYLDCRGAPATSWRGGGAWSPSGTSECARKYDDCKRGCYQ